MASEITYAQTPDGRWWQFWTHGQKTHGGTEWHARVTQMPENWRGDAFGVFADVMVIRAERPPSSRQLTDEEVAALLGQARKARL